MILHLITIQDKRTDDTVFHGFDRAALRLKVAAYCRENWPHEMTDDNAEAMPDDEDELIELYFHEHDREFLIEQELSIELPQPYATAPDLLEACRTAQQALDTDASAIGKAQCSGDIDWFKFGEATIAKQTVAMPCLQAAIAAATAAV